MYSHMYYVSGWYNSSMNNKHLSWYKEINNNFVIASRAYFLQMNPAAKSRATSSPIAFHHSSLNRRRNCLTGLYFGSILRVCSASPLGTPGMSEGFHAKMSRFSWMNSMSALSYLGSKLALMLNCLDESPGVKSTSLVSAADLNFMAGSCSVVGFLREVISAGSTLSW